MARGSLPAGPISLLWDGRFSFHEHRSVWADRDWLFRPGIEFVDSSSEAHEVVKLHPGHALADTGKSTAARLKSSSAWLTKPRMRKRSVTSRKLPISGGKPPP